jgi:hypothetical protein
MAASLTTPVRERWTVTAATVGRPWPAEPARSAGQALKRRMIHRSWRRCSPAAPLAAIPTVVVPTVAIPSPPVPTTVPVATVVPVIAVRRPEVPATVPTLAIPTIVNPVMAIPSPPVSTTRPVAAVVPVIAVVPVREVDLAGADCSRLRDWGERAGRRRAHSESHNASGTERKSAPSKCCPA